LEKPFLFILQNISLQTETELLQLHIAAQLGIQVKIYRAFKKEIAYLTVVNGNDEAELTKKLEENKNLISLENGQSLVPYQNYMHDKKDAYRAKMKLHNTDAQPFDY
jgi:hypothetical protein